MENKDNRIKMVDPKKLIEVAMPIKEISAESVRDKSIRSGHISTLHLWWARRPLPASRAVTFASLVPDPLDKNCPKEFVDAVNHLLGPNKSGIDHYKPYKDIPHTAAIDMMEDNPRNRLMMFIGKFSEKYIDNTRLGKTTPTKDKISKYSLIKSENRTDEKILNIARKLIWVAHNPKVNTLAEFDSHWKEIKDKRLLLESERDGDFLSTIASKEFDKALKTFTSRMPAVFDPFAGGGAIPLEIARLGCRSYANDINPVAHIIQRASLEYPQKFGLATEYSIDNFKTIYPDYDIQTEKRHETILRNGEISALRIPNKLSFDVAYLGKELIRRTGEKAKIYYPQEGEKDIPIVFYWVRTAKCVNRSCQAEVPLLKHFYLSRKRSAPKSEWIHFNPIIDGNKIDFEISKGELNLEGWNNRGNMTCPCCQNVTTKSEIKKQSVSEGLKPRMIAVIEDTVQGRIYRKPNSKDVETLGNVPDVNIPQENMQRNSAGGDTFSWGYTKWGQLFSKRQLATINVFTEEIKSLDTELQGRYSNSEYVKALTTYMAILLDRVVMRMTSFNTWHVQQDTIEHIFNRQAIAMMFDFPEMNPFTKYTSSAINQLSAITNYIDSEGKIPFYSIANNSASGDVMQFEENYLDAVVTDPPYYDAIAYADLSDFFYIWLKRTLTEHYPMVFATPQTPKSGECTALKHHHENSLDKAQQHFEDTLKNIFQVIQKQVDGPVSVMFAHQSTRAWTTLCNSILGNDLNITGSWAIDTEQTSALKSNKAYLASSVTVSCRPVTKEAIGDFREIKKNINDRIKIEVKNLYELGFRGSDLLTACFGQAVSEFGRFNVVEKADGSLVTVEELLEMARDAAFNAIVSDIITDDFTRFYIGWLNLFGFSEAEHDDVRRVTQIGLSIDTNELVNHNIMIREGAKEKLAGFAYRAKKNSKLGNNKRDHEIDVSHRLMLLYKNGDRNSLLKYIQTMNLDDSSGIWRVLNSLIEILPESTIDYKQVQGLLTNKESLLRDSKNIKAASGEQVNLDFE